MKIGLSLGMSAPSGGGPSGPTSLYDSSDFNEADDSHRESELGGNVASFRAARNGGGNGIFTLTVPNGDYRMTYDLSAYDGAESVSGVRLRIQDNTTTLFTDTAAGAVDETFTISNGLIRFLISSTDLGYRVDNFFIEAA